MESLRDHNVAGSGQLHDQYHAISPRPPPPPPEGKHVGLPIMSLELQQQHAAYDGRHPYHETTGAKPMQTGYKSLQLQQPNKLIVREASNSNINSNIKPIMTPPGRSPAGFNRRPRSSAAFDAPNINYATIGHIPPANTAPTDSTSTASDDTRSTGKSDLDYNQQLWKVKVAGETEYLESSSYNSGAQLHDNDADAQHASRVLGQLKLNTSDDNDDKEKEKDSSTATTKVSNFTFQKKIQQTNKCSAIMTAYYRPVDTLAKDGTGYNPALSPPRPATNSVTSAALRSRSSRSGSRASQLRFQDMANKKRDEIISEPSNLSVEFDTIPAGLSSLSYASSHEMDSPKPLSSPMPHDNKIPMRCPPNNNNNNNNFQRKQHYLRPDAISKSATMSDEDIELKRMESVSRTFQRNDNESKSKNSKFSAVPLSGIGVDVSRNHDDDCHRVHTPREAANAQCSISSMMENMFGMTPPKKDGGNRTPQRLSPFNIMKNILCSPEGIHNVGSTKNSDRMKSSQNEGSDDDWSVGADVSQPGSRCTFDEDERGSRSRSRYSSSYVPDNRREYNNKGNNGSRSPVRNRNSRTSLPNRSSNGSNRNIISKPSVERRSTLQDKYGHSHKEDTSYYGTDVDAGIRSCYTSHYTCASGDDRSRSKTMSPLSNAFQDRRYRDRDSPFVRRFDDRYDDDDTRYR